MLTIIGLVFVLIVVVPSVLIQLSIERIRVFSADAWRRIRVHPPGACPGGEGTVSLEPVCAATDPMETLNRPEDAAEPLRVCIVRIGEVVRLVEIIGW